MSPEEADQAFVIGVFSMLDQMLGMPQAGAVGLLNLPMNYRRRCSSAAMFMAGCSTWSKPAKAATTELRPGRAGSPLTSQQINWAHLRALAWTDAITRPDHLIALSKNSITTHVQPTDPATAAEPGAEDADNQVVIARQGHPG